MMEQDLVQVRRMKVGVVQVGHFVVQGVVANLELGMA